jgi:iron(III) transport system substrate-binding protein
MKNIWKKNRIPGGALLAAIAIGAAIVLAGCRRKDSEVVVYTAQDRVFAEPVLEDFARKTGITPQPVHDNEATKTTGLANRLLRESERPLADVWWSNEEMRTRQLARAGVLENAWRSFGRRSRVLVVKASEADKLSNPASLAVLTNQEFRGRVVIAYPVFGTTATHFLALRQRWGDEAWRQWCLALAENRPLLVDGNSVVVRTVAGGEGLIGLTDSDDVAFGRREGLDVVALNLPPVEGLDIPNTVGKVVGGPNPAGADRLIQHLTEPQVARRLVEAGALDPEGTNNVPAATLGEAEWRRLLDDLDPALKWLEQTFAR